MRLPIALRRVALVAASSSLLAVVPFAAPASAHELTAVTPGAALNTNVVTVEFDTQEAFLSVPSDPTVVFARTAALGETKPATSVEITDQTHVTVEVDLTRLNPGAYDIEITGMVVGEVDPVEEDCHGCFTVTAFTPAVTSVSPMTVGQGASGVTFEINGNHFTNAAYCSAAPCTDQPSVLVSGTGVNLTGSGTAGAEVNATLTKITKKIQVDSNAATGARNVTVTNTDGKTATCTGCLVIAAAPTLTGISPVGGLANGATNRTVVLTGTNFSPTATVVIEAITGSTNGVTYTTKTVDSPTQITLTGVNVDGNPTNAPVGARRIKITNPDFGSVSNESLFTVNAKPTVSGVDYVDNTGTGYGRGALNRDIEITGTGFKPGATVVLASPTGITINSTTVNPNTTNITLKVTLTQRGTGEPALSTHSITVTNTDGGVSGTATSFTVNEGPKINSVTPMFRARNVTTNLTLTGLNFDTNGVNVSVEDATVNGTPTVNSATSITVNVTTGNVVGLKDVTVENSGDKGRYVCNDCFSIDNLQVDSISPSPTAAENQTLTITGAGFDTNAVATLIKIGTPVGAVPDVVGTSTVVNISGTSLTATFALANGAPGNYAVRVSNPTNGTGTCNCEFVVNAPAPAITSVTPNNRGEGSDDETITIVGTNFAPGATVTFSNSHVSIVGTPVITPTQITLKIDVGPLAYTEDTTPAVPAEAQEITVTNTDGQDDSETFTIGEAPTAADTDITSRAQGTATAIKLTGDKIQPNATLVISGEGVTAGAGTVVVGPGPAEDTVTATVTVASDAPLTTRTVYVRNPDGGRATCAGCTLTINPQPTFTSVAPSPAKAARGAATTLTLTGTGFATGATVPDGDGFTATGEVLVNSTTLTVSITPTVGATLGLRDLTVNNTDGGSATKTDAFKVFTVPGAPTGVSAIRGNGKATVSWTAPASDGNDPITGYTVTSNPGGLTSTVDAATFTTDVTGLTNGTPYTFTVVATNAAGNSAASDPSTAVTPATVPGAPTAVSATPGNAQASVSWTAPVSNGGSTITGYTVTSSPGGLTKTVDGTTTTGIVTGLTNGTAYTFTVVATNDVGNSVASDPSTAVTPATVPDAPFDVSAVASDSSAFVSWTAPVSNGGSPITGYTVTSSPGGITGTTDGTTTSKNITGLTNGTAYTFTVVATNAKGDSVASTPSPSVTPNVVPGAPTSVTATAGNATAHVTWVAPTNTGTAITGYTVTSSPGGLTANVDGSTLAADVNGLTNGTEYTFTVVATNAAGNSAASAASNAVTPATVPDAPTGVSATAGNTEATVQWSAPAGNGGSAITGYTVTASPGGATKSVDAATLSTTVTGLTNGTAYTFTVVATNAKGNSVPSAASTAVTPNVVPLAPTGVTATRGDTAASVSWTAPASNGGTAVTHYTVTSDPGNKTVTVDGGTLTAVVTGLTNGTSYTFTVFATNAKGNGATSAISNAVTPAGIPAAPATVTATAGHATAAVTWAASTANGSPVTSYTVTMSPGGTTKTVTGTSTSYTGLSNGTSYTFTVKAVNAVGTGAGTTSNAVVPTWVTSVTESATSRIVSGGTSVVSGRLARSDGIGVNGASIKIYRRVAPATTYTFVRTVTTGANGVWSTSFVLTKNTRFKALFVGATGYDAATSPIRLTAVKYRVSATYALSGRTITVTGSVSPNAASRAIYLRHRRSDGTYVNLRTGTVAANGTYRLVRTLPPGLYSMDVYIGASTTNIAGDTAQRSQRIT